MAIRCRFYCLVFSDIFLLIAAIPSILLPILGFIATAVQVRYKSEYVECLGKLDSTYESETVNLPLLKLLRAMICLFYTYSILYFGFIIRPSDRYYAPLSVVFAILNLVIIAGAAWGLSKKSTYQCQDSGFSMMISAMYGIGMAVCIVVLLAAVMLYIFFNVRKGINVKE